VQGGARPATLPFRNQTQPRQVSRLIQITIGGAIVAAILVGILYQGLQSTVFFHTPSEILAAPADFQGKTIRIGALVEPNSTRWDEDTVRLEFKLTEDSKELIPVVFNGVKPDMYREGQGVVVEGSLDSQGVFQAHTLLVKHSEEYDVDQAKRNEKEKVYKTLLNN
jgi:cytochrome c-type biogenesis protein CcmE